MSILKEATNSIGFMKAGFLGFGGSGKTTTAALLAIGLSKQYGKYKSVAMLDTERGSDFLIPLFREHGITFYPVRSRAFRDLLQMCNEARHTCDVVMVDSITHVWREACSAYMNKKNRRRLKWFDYGPIKEEWQKFLDLYVNGPYHCILNGRAGFEFDEEENEDGDKELVKRGVKMKAEGETGFEPSFLVEMQRLQRGKFDESDHKTHGWNHRAIVLKDRAMKLNGEIHDFGAKGVSVDEVMEWVKPHLDCLNLGGNDKGIDTLSTSEDLFESDKAAHDYRKRREVHLDLIKDTLIKRGISGTGKEEKKACVFALEEAFGTSSWTAIEGLELDDLKAGLEVLRIPLKPVPVEAPALDTVTT